MCSPDRLVWLPEWLQIQPGHSLLGNTSLQGRVAGSDARSQRRPDHSLRQRATLIPISARNRSRFLTISSLFLVRNSASHPPLLPWCELCITSRKRVVHQVLAPRGRDGGCVEASMIAQSVGCSLGCSHSQLGKRVEPLSAGVHSRRAGARLCSRTKRGRDLRVPRPAMRPSMRPSRAAAPV
jgi:hypothetical protein